MVCGGMTGAKAELGEVISGELAFLYGLAEGANKLVSIMDIRLAD
jgi:hypothetical protein